MFARLTTSTLLNANAKTLTAGWMGRAQPEAWGIEQDSVPYMT